jgi:hypothetical protein
MEQLELGPYYFVNRCVAGGCIVVQLSRFLKIQDAKNALKVCLAQSYATEHVHVHMHVPLIVRSSLMRNCKLSNQTCEPVVKNFGSIPLVMRMQIMFEMFLYFGSYRYAICIKF